MRAMLCPVLAAALTLGATAPASASMLLMDFDTDASGNAIRPGQVIDNEYAAWGVAIEVANYQRPHDLGIAFDSANPTGGDGDLRTPGPGHANTVAYHNVLIIAENNFDGNGDGLIDDPDDEGAQLAGHMRFTFSTPQREGSITLVDIEEANATVELLSAGRGVTSLSVASVGDNGVQTIGWADIEFDQVVVRMTGSGAVAELAVMPEPATLILLLMPPVAIVLLRRRHVA